MVKVLGIDPGVTTGFALVRFEDDDDDVNIALGEWHGMEELDKYVEAQLFDVDWIAIERYLIYPNRAQSHIGDDLYTAQEIGRVKWIVFKQGIPEDHLAEHSASMAKGRWPDSRLKLIFDIPRGTSPHMKDALRHALTLAEREEI
jgi:hypothetical protein